MFSPIKGPLKRLAKKLRNYIRYCWGILIDAEHRFRSWLEITILPIWTILVSIWKILRRIFHSPSQDAVIDETTPLLSEDPLRTNDPKSSDHPIPVTMGSNVPVRPLDIRVSPIFNLSLDPMKPEIFFYWVDPYCVLCRKTFESGEGSGWDHRCLAICPATIKSSQRYFAVMLETVGATKDTVPPIGMEENPPMLANMHIVKPSLHRKGSRFPLPPPNSHLRHDAYAVHRTCRNFAASVFKDQHIHRLIFRFGQSTKYLSRTCPDAATWNGTLRSLTPYLASLDQNDGVAKLLHGISLFPTEIEDEIRDESENDLLSNIINFCRTTVPLIDSMNEIGLHVDYLWFKSYTHLMAQTSMIYDSTYMNTLTLHPQALTTESAPPTISIQNMKGIQIALGVYGIGIAALKILYQDGTSSACIGTSSDGPFITIIGSNISGLKILKDSLKITAIELVAERVWYVKQRQDYSDNLLFPIDFREKSYMLPSYVSFSNLTFSGWRVFDQKSLKNRNFNTWQMCSHIPLFKDKEYVRSMTIYCLHNAICGIVFHGRRYEKQGFLGVRNPLACAIHLEFCLGERLIHVLSGIHALNVDGFWGKDHCPSLIVTTDFARTVVCQSVSTSKETLLKYSKVHNPENKTISRLFTDGTTNPDGSIRNLGVSYNNDPIRTEPSVPATGCPETEHIHIQTSALPESWTHAFVSTATFDSVKKISIRKTGDRVLGIRIRHHDERPTETLGQFDPSFPSQISTPYKSERDGSLLQIRFQLKAKAKVGWGDAACEYVCGIQIWARHMDIPHDFEEIPVKEFTLGSDKLSQPVEWLFTATNDCVRLRTENSTQKVEIDEGGPTRELLLNPGLDLPEREVDPNFVLWDEHEGMGSDDED